MDMHQAGADLFDVHGRLVELGDGMAIDAAQLGKKFAALEQLGRLIADVIHLAVALVATGFDVLHGVHRGLPDVEVDMLPAIGLAPVLLLADSQSRLIRRAGGIEIKSGRVLGPRVGGERSGVGGTGEIDVVLRVDALGLMFLPG